MAFTPRLVVPNNGDIHYTRTGYGGLNPCIPGIPEAWTGSVLANCVGYCWGRWWELLNTNPHLCSYDAKYWWNYNDGYSRGSQPQLGAIICFDSSNAGHVAVVEEIIDANTIRTSNSAYQQTIFYTQILRRSNNWTWNSAFTFQGFIYLPTEPVPQPDYIQYILKKNRRIL